MRQPRRERKPWFPAVRQNFRLEVTAEMLAQVETDGAPIIAKALASRFRLDGAYVQVLNSFGSVAKSPHSKTVIMIFIHSQEAKEFLQKIHDGESVRTCKLSFTRIR